jgi:hypothetical protein
VGAGTKLPPFAAARGGCERIEERFKGRLTICQNLPDSSVSLKELQDALSKMSKLGASK